MSILKEFLPLCDTEIQHYFVDNSMSCQQILMIFGGKGATIKPFAFGDLV